MAELLISFPLTIAPADTPPPPGGRLRFDFGTADSPVMPGWTRVTHLAGYTPLVGHGFTSGGVDSRDRGPGVPGGDHSRLEGDDLTRDFVFARDLTFRVDLPSGEHWLKLLTGDFSGAQDATEIYLNGVLVATHAATSGHVETYYFRFNVSDGKLLLRMRGALAYLAVLNALEIDGEYLPPNALKATHRLDFGPWAVTPPAGYVKATKTDFYNVQRGYGWLSHRGLPQEADRGGTPLIRDFVYGRENLFRVDVPAGEYDVTVTSSDRAAAYDYNLYLQGVLADAVVITAGQVYERTFRVFAPLGKILIFLHGGELTAHGDQTLLNALRIDPAGAPPPPPPAPTASLSVDPVTIAAGGTATLTWTTTDATSATIDDEFGDPESVPVAGSQIVSPLLTTTYTLQATGAGGSAGGTATLTWTTTDATSATIDDEFGDPESVPVAGSQIVSPLLTTTYTLLATGAGGSASRTATLSVTPIAPPPPPPPPGGSPPPTPAVTIAYGSHDRGPDFGANPTLSAVKTGFWSDPSVWGGRLPTIADSVRIPSGRAVTLETTSAEAGILTLDGGGSLAFADWDARLRVGTLFTRQGSILGFRPILGVKHETIFIDYPFDANDPSQFGHGLVILGDVTIRAPFRTPFARSTREIPAGASTLTFAEPVAGWKAGDVLALPDSRNLARGPLPDWPTWTNHGETVTVASVNGDGRGVTLASPTRHAHPGVKDPDGTLRFTPHVGNLTRDVVFRSENPTGVRGHAQFFHHAGVDLEGAAFVDMGRSTVDPFSPTNQKGRYACHCHHLHGSARLVNLAVYGTTPTNRVRGGIVLHDTHRSTVSDCTLWNLGGAGIAEEEGNETGNVIERNFVFKVEGRTNTTPDPRSIDPSRDGWWEGSCVWLRAGGAILRDNVCGDAFYPYSVMLSQLPVSMTRPTGVGHEVESFNPYHVPLRWQRNECYGGRTSDGVSLWQLGDLPAGAWDSVPRSFIVDMIVWNVFHAAYYAYVAANVTWENPEFYGGGMTPVGFYGGHYTPRNQEIIGGVVQGFHWGYLISPNANQLVQGGVWRNNINWEVRTQECGGASHDAFVPMTFTLRNVVSAPAAGSEPPTHIKTVHSLIMGADMLATQRIAVEGWQGVPGDDFRVYFHEQAGGYVMPPSNPSANIVGSPEPKLTNAELWAKYGKCYNGELAPADATTRPGIVGLVK